MRNVMTAKLKYTSILACSIALAMPFSSYAIKKGASMEGFGAKNTPTTSETPASTTPNKAAVSDANNINTTNASIANEVNTTLNKSIDILSSKIKTSLGNIDKKYAAELDSFIASKNDEKGIQAATESVVEESLDKYVGTAATMFSGVPAHLRLKMEELDRKILDINNQAVVATNKKVQKNVEEYVSHVEGKFTTLLANVEDHFDMLTITRSEKINQLIYKALGATYKASASKNDTRTDVDDVTAVVKAYLVNGAPSVTR
jgi:hypothetical protein